MCTGPIVTIDDSPCKKVLSLAECMQILESIARPPGLDCMDRYSLGLPTTPDRSDT